MKKIKKVNAIKGISATLLAMREMADNGSLKGRDDVFRTKLHGIVIDTCSAFDTGLWETAIQKSGGSCHIAEQYENREQAETGHAKWVELLKHDPNAKIPSLMLWD